MKQVFHHYEKWEEYQAGMWRSLHGKEYYEYLNKAIIFTGNAKLYGEWMMKVIDKWPVSCEHNLTDKNQNRQAWIGHAACCLAIKCPENITREAWGVLSEQQRVDANKQADIAIAEWARRYEEKDKTIPKQMEFTGIS